MLLLTEKRGAKKSYHGWLMRHLKSGILKVNAIPGARNDSDNASRLDFDARTRYVDGARV